jgi:hypothetical protein
MGSRARGFTRSHHAAVAFPVALLGAGGLVAKGAALAIATADVARHAVYAGVAARSGITVRTGTRVGLCHHAVAVLTTRLARIRANHLPSNWPDAQARREASGSAGHKTLQKLPSTPSGHGPAEGFEAVSSQNGLLCDECVERGLGEQPRMSCASHSSLEPGRSCSAHRAPTPQPGGDRLRPQPEGGTGEGSVRAARRG